MEERWNAYVAAVMSGLHRLVVTDERGLSMTAADGFTRWQALTSAVADRGKNVYLIGNGASAAMASHFAADACKAGGLRALAFNDAALLTAVGNDRGFDQAFALPLTLHAREADLLIAISSSGASPDILAALQVADDAGLDIVTLSGRDPDNPARRFGHVNFYVPQQRYGWIESAHQVILHHWLDRYVGTEESV